MSSKNLNRKDFLLLSVSIVTTSTLAACGEDDPAGGGTAGAPGASGSGTSGSGGSAAGSGGAGGGGGPATGAGTSAGGSAAGSGGSAAGSGGASAGGGGAGGSSGGGAGGAGGGGTGGSNGGGMCMSITEIEHDENTHDHIPDDDGAEMTFLMNLANHINGATATAAFTLPSEGQTPHTHTITFTAPEIAMLKSGGTLMGKKAEMAASAGGPHSHTYTITCMA